MSTFAKLDANDFVISVLVIEQEMVNTGLFGDPDSFVQTSYNTRGGIHYGQDGLSDGGLALRKNYAGIGYKFDRVRDAFIPPKNFPSWVLNEESCLWEAPTPMPTDGKPYRWDEPTLAWVEIVSTQSP